MILVRLGMRPADALGLSDPVRPFVTGGLGIGINLVLIEDWINGELKLTWHFTAKDGVWVFSTPLKVWDLSEAEKVHAMGEMELLRIAQEAGFAWSTVDLELAHAFTGFGSKWNYSLLAKWTMSTEAEQKWTLGNAGVKWVFGEVN